MPALTPVDCLRLQPIGGLRDFFEINLELARPNSPVTLLQADEAIESRGHMAPPSTIHACEIVNTLIGEGTVLRVCPLCDLLCAYGNCARGDARTMQSVWDIARFAW